MLQVVEHALSLVRDGMVIGLGTGRAASVLIEALGIRVRAGLSIRGVPTSRRTEKLAQAAGIPVVRLDDIDAIDLAFDGADEVDPALDLIKGLGGALVREKIVAAAAAQFIVMVSADKLVPALGTRGVVPVEILPFGLAPCRRRLAELGCDPVVRVEGQNPFVSDNGNYILDCRIGPVADAAALDRRIRDVPGVVGTGFFLQMAHQVLIQNGDALAIRRR